MLSRLAESLYWIGRNVERAEDVARAIDVTYHAILEAPRAQGQRSQWEALLQISGDPEGFAARHTPADIRNVID